MFALKFVILVFGVLTLVFEVNRLLSVVERLRAWLMESEIISWIVGNMKINDPVHKIEANKTNWKYNTRIFVDVRGRTSI